MAPTFPTLSSKRDVCAWGGALWAGFSSDAQLRRMRRGGRPPIGRAPRQAVSLRLDPDVLAKVKKRATKRDEPYQSLINDILARAVRRASER